MLLVHLSMMQSHDEHVSTRLHCFNPLDSPLALALSERAPRHFRTGVAPARFGISTIRLAETGLHPLGPLCKWDTRSLRLRLGLATHMGLIYRANYIVGSLPATNAKSLLDSEVV